MPSSPNNHEIYRDKRPHEDGKFYVKTFDGGRVEATQKEYEAEQEKEAARKHEEDLRDEANNTAKQQLVDAGYQSYCHYHDRIDDRAYQQRLVKVMREQHATNSHVEPPTATSSASDNTAVHSSSDKVELARTDTYALFQQLLPDRYTDTIISLLTAAEEKVASYAITSEEHRKIVTLFVIGHINSPELFLRYEKLKQTEMKMQLKSLYTYDDLGYHDKISRRKRKPPRTILRIGTLETLFWQMKNQIITPEDLDTPTGFHTKIGANYIVEVKTALGGPKGRKTNAYYNLMEYDTYADLTGEEKELFDTWKSQHEETIHRDRRFPAERNSLINIWKCRDIDQQRLFWKHRYRDSFNSYDMQKHCGFSRDEIAALHTQAQQAAIDDLITICNNPQRLLYNHEYEVDSTDRICIDIDAIIYIFETIPHIAPDIDISALRSTLTTQLVSILGLPDDLTIDEPAPSAQRDKFFKKKSSYAARVETSIQRKKKICTLLKKLGQGENPCVQARNQVDTTLGENLITAYRTSYATKRIAKVFSTDGLSDEMDLPTIRTKLVALCAPKLIKAYRSYPHQDVHLPRRSHHILTHLLNKKILFLDGYYTLVKRMIPVTAARKRFRVETQKQIIAEALRTTIAACDNDETIDHYSYHLTYMLREQYTVYGGKKRDIPRDHKAIEARYRHYFLTKIPEELLTYTKAVDRYITGKSEKSHNILLTYLKLLEGSTMLRNKLARTISQYPIAKDQPTDTHKSTFQENNAYLGQYPGSYLRAASLSHETVSSLAAKIPEETLSHHINSFHSRDNAERKFFRHIIEQQIQSDMIVGGKYHRVLLEAYAGQQPTRNDIQQFIISIITPTIIQDLRTIFFVDTYDSFSSGTLHTIHGIIAEIVERIQQAWNNQIAGDTNNTRHLPPPEK